MMRTLGESLFWRMNRGWPRRRPRFYRPMRSVHRSGWSVLWLLMGLGLAFSPDFRGLFIGFWVGFAQVAAALARGLAAILAAPFQ